MNDRGSVKKQSAEVDARVSQGKLLEARVMRLFARQRYFVRRDIVIHTEGSLNQATDLDVVALKWVAPFRKHLQIVECKSGKERPLDRIFWLSGVRAYTNADSAMLVRADTKWDIKSFARECDVYFLDMNSLALLENRLQLSDSLWPAIADAPSFASRDAQIAAFAAKEAATKDVSRFLKGEFRWERPSTSMRYLLLNMRRLVRMISEENAEPAATLLLVDCLSQFTMFATALAAQTLEMRLSDAREFIYREAKFGSTDPRVASRFMRLARRITEETLHELGVSPVRIDEQRFNFPEPQNVEELIAIQQMMLERAGLTEDLAAFIDAVAMERVVRKSDGKDWINLVFGQDAASLASVARNMSELLENIEALPRGFSAVFNLTEPGEPSLRTDKKDESGGILETPLNASLFDQPDTAQKPEGSTPAK